LVLFHRRASINAPAPCLHGVIASKPSRPPWKAPSTPD
jgi:hypothetical protein